jgi:PmbA protein
MAKRISERLGAMADAYELFSADSRSLNVSFENDRLNEISQAESSGVGIRAVKRGKIGFSYSSKPGAVDEVAESAVRLAQWGKPYSFEFAAKQTSEHKLPHDPACGDLSPERLIETCTRVKEVIKAVDPDAQVDCSIGGGVSTDRIATSRGQDCSENGSSFSYMLSARISEEGNFISIYRYRRSRSIISDDEILAQAGEAADEFKIARKVVPFHAGKYRVLFSPHVVSDLLTPITVSINGMNIARKTSRFVDAKGEKLFDERLTLEDDPVHPDGCLGGAYDGEGIVTVKRAIVDRGTLAGFVHTLSTAQQCNDKPTGNAQRSVSSQPVPGVHNLVMAAGDGDVGEMMKQAEGGLCISETLGTFTSNFLAGQVSGNVSLGFLIKDGKRVGRVKNCAMGVNGFDLLKSQIVAISKEREWVGNQYLPWLLADGVAISARD